MPNEWNKIENTLETGATNSDKIIQILVLRTKKLEPRQIKPLSNE